MALLSRRAWRRLAFGLATLMGSRPRGYFIPYRYADTTPRGRGYGAVEAVLAAAADDMRALLREIERHGDTLAAFAGPPPLPRWTQDWFPRLDGAAAYTLVRARAPRRIVEVGSGHSTRFMMKALTDGAIDCRFTAIDPAPRADIAALPLRHIPSTMQAAGLAPFAELAAGDILFIDSSHILMPGTDVDLLFTEILPRLPAGVLVHVHDILLPDDYPRTWWWRGYNEQSLAALLLTGGGWRPLFASHYVATRLAAEVAAGPLARLPLPEGALETSLWIEKR